MQNWHKLLLTSLILTTSAFGSVTSYFNQNQSSSYTDPYRKITRQGDDLEAVILNEIKSAKKTVFLAVQELRLPLIAKALIDKKNEGVDVRVVLEHDYNFDVLSQRDEDSDNEHEASRISELHAFVDMNKNGRFEKSELETRDAIYMLKNSNVPLIDDTSNGTKGSGLMHHKFVIIDGKTTVVSSANFTLSCVHGDWLAPQTRGNANSLIVVQSPAFAQIFSEEFNQLWGNGRRGNFGQNKTYRGPQTVTVRGVKLTVQFSPTSRRFHWEESVNGLIASELAKAQKSIKAALFVFSEQNISDVMEKRQAAGAQVGAFIEPKFAYRFYSELLDMLGIQLLNPKCAYQPGNNPWKVPAKEAGMARPINGDTLHHKFAVVDNKTVIMGSQNWSDAANYINDETLVVVEGKGISDSYTQEYERVKRTGLIGPSASVMTQIRRQEEQCTNLGFRF